MRKARKPSQIQKIRMILEKKFAKGERYTLSELVKTVFDPNTPYKYLVAEKQMRSILQTIKSNFLKISVAFGAINPDHEYGIPKNKAEFEFLGFKRYQMWKGLSHNAGIIVDMGVKQGFIKLDSKTDTIKLPLVGESYGD